MNRTEIIDILYWLESVRGLTIAKVESSFKFSHRDYSTDTNGKLADAYIKYKKGEE